MVGLRWPLAPSRRAAVAAAGSGERTKTRAVRLSGAVRAAESAQQDDVRAQAFGGLDGLAGVVENLDLRAAPEQGDERGVAVDDHDSKGLWSVRTHPASGGHLARPEHSPDARTKG